MSLHDKTVADARRNIEQREQGYREKSLKMLTSARPATCAPLDPPASTSRVSS